MAIADEMGIRYPRNPDSDTPYVLTTDFMLAVQQSGKLVQKARTVKPLKDLETQSVAEKLELEKRVVVNM